MTACFAIVLPTALVVGAVAGLVLSPHRAKRARGYR